MIRIPRHRRAPHIYSLVALSALGFGLAGCGESVSDSPLIADQQQSIQRLDERTQDLDKRIEDLNLTLTTLNNELMNAQNTPLGQSQRLAVMDRDIKTLQSAAQQTSRTVGELKQILVEQQIELSRLAANRGVPSSGSDASIEHAANEAESDSRVASVTAKVVKRPSEVESPVRQAPSRPSGPPAALASATSEPEPAPTVDNVPTGFYYFVRSGESLSSIAESQRVTVEDLRQANRIPPGREPHPGSRIFVPSAG